LSRRRAYNRGPSTYKFPPFGSSKKPGLTRFSGVGGNPRTKAAYSQIQPPSKIRNQLLLTAKRDRKAALRFLRKAIKWNGMPEKITIDKSGANMAAIESQNVEHGAGIEIRQIKYLNNIVEQDHRAIKRLVRPMLGFKSFRSAAVTLAGVELMRRIRKGQLETTGEMRPARQLYSLAG
jgi:transposase-like protein